MANSLAAVLRNTNPVHDAWWLERIESISIGGYVKPFDDSDGALRFVRFVDRVYDRDVVLQFGSRVPEPEELIPNLAADRRFRWHAVRCESRLTELLADACRR